MKRGKYSAREEGVGTHRHCHHPRFQRERSHGPDSKVTYSIQAGEKRGTGPVKEWAGSWGTWKARGRVKMCCDLQDPQPLESYNQQPRHKFHISTFPHLNFLIATLSCTDLTTRKECDVRAQDIVQPSRKPHFLLINILLYTSLT